MAIVDDDSAFANYLRTFLSLRGYDTRSYSRGDEMLAAVKAGDPPDIVLLDVMMPGMNGIELASLLLATHPDLKILYVSGYCELLAESGGYEYVAKPFTPAAILAKIRKLIPQEVAGSPGNS